MKKENWARLASTYSSLCVLDPGMQKPEMGSNGGHKSKYHGLDLCSMSR